MHAILAARSNFSIGESILAIDTLVDRAAGAGAKAVGVTDTMSATCLIELTQKAQKAGIKPVIGCRLRLVDDVTWRKTKDSKKVPPEFFVTWYVLSQTGLMALYRLLSLANSEDRVYNVPKLSFDDLYAELANVSAADVALATSDAHSVVSHKSASQILAKISDALSASNTFCTLVPIDTPYWDTQNVRALQLAEELGLPTLVAAPALYEEGSADAADIMNAVTRNVKLTEPWAWFNPVRDLHPKTLQELVRDVKAAAKRLEEFRGVPTKGRFSEGMKNTARLVDMVTFAWAKSAPSLPIMAPDEFKAVVEACTKGWHERFTAPVFGHRPSNQELKEVYQPRLLYELTVLKNLNFSGYFLLVQDVVVWAKSQGILVGPGRGSVGGSLVAYLMGITDCDPLRFELLFERFINPERIDLPDADLDFMSERRHEVFQYLIRKYGTARVAGVSNYGRLGASSAIRDVSRVFGLNEELYRCSKFVPKKHGQPVKLTAAAEEVSEIAAFRDANPEIWDTAEKLEGCLRNLSQHAAGVVVGGVDLVERAVIERRKAPSKPKEGEEAVPDLPVVCWDKRIVEDQGLVKMDILGLNTLDLIALTIDYIRKRRGKKVDLLRIPLDEPKVLDNFARAVSTGIFQFEGGSSRRMLKDMDGGTGTLNFDDLVAANALNRPGPIEAGLVQKYIEGRNGATPSYAHPRMEPALKDTYGVMAYQEQLMRISRDLCGFSGPDADKLRKAIGKKDPILMKSMKDQFVAGAHAGYVEITLEDGAKKQVHRHRKFAVKETSGKFTAEQIANLEYTLAATI